MKRVIASELVESCFQVEIYKTIYNKNKIISVLFDLNDLIILILQTDSTTINEIKIIK